MPFKTIINRNSGDISTYVDWLSRHCPEKVTDAIEAISKIRNGSKVFIGTGCGEPQHLIRTLVENPNATDIMVYQMLSSTLAEFVNDPLFLERFSLKLFFVSYAMRQAAFEGKIDYVPAYLSQIPDLFANRRIGLDVALVQVSPPDDLGYCSLGVSLDITRAGLENAKMVIAQINSHMPRTLGEGFVHVNQFDSIVLYDEPLVESLPRIGDTEVARRIGYYVSQLVEDGATLQIGFGHLPYAILSHLENKNDLGIHTQLITDGFLPLFEKRVITNKKKTLLTDKVAASLCMGSEKLYQYVDNNPLFEFRPSEFVNNPAVIARNDNFVSISSALEVDLTGQVCSDSIGYLFYSGIGDQVDFIRGSAMSRGGFSIIALPSTAQNGRLSRIVPHISEGGGVATTRGDVNFVVTEYGIADLAGKSIYQRVMELAQIAHPKFREELIHLAKKRRYIFSDQLPPQPDDLIFLEGYKDVIKIKNGKTIEIRPLFPSDELEYRSFFYSLKKETIYYRFFYMVKSFTHEMAQQQYFNIDYRKNMTLIGLVQHKGHKEIVAIGSYAEKNADYAEAAFVVSDQYQRMGLGEYLLGRLEEIAKENGYKGFTASVLKENTKMFHLFKKQYENITIESEDSGVLSIRMPFSTSNEP